jgi:hypothetical protein
MSWIFAERKSSWQLTTGSLQPDAIVKGKGLENKYIYPLSFTYYQSILCIGEAIGTIARSYHAWYSGSTLLLHIVCVTATNKIR